MKSGGSHFCNWVAPVSCNLPLWLRPSKQYLYISIRASVRESYETNSAEDLSQAFSVVKKRSLLKKFQSQYAEKAWS